VSGDGTNWQNCLDRGDNRRDSPHDYAQLPAPVMARFVRLVNVHSPGGGLFSVSGFRIFGSGLGKIPAKVNGITADRDPADSRQLQVSWKSSGDTDFYIIRYGVARDRLFNNYQVYGTNRFAINSLNAGTSYYLTVDAVNDSGIARGKQIVLVK
jgi:hypothetical protein